MECKSYYHELFSKITAIRGELIFAVLHYQNTTITVQLIVVTTTSIGIWFISPWNIQKNYTYKAVNVTNVYLAEHVWLLLISRSVFSREM